MKKLYIIIIVFMLGGCDSSKNIKQNDLSLILNSFYIDKNNSINISFYKGYENSVKKYAYFDNQKKIWINEEVKQFKLDSDDVSFEKNMVTVKKDNQTIFTKELPIATDIENELNISLEQNYIKYTTYRNLKNLKWDRKSYIISVLDIDKKTIYYIFMKDLNGSFSYYIYNKGTFYPSSTFDDGLSFYSFDKLNDYRQNNIEYLKYSIDSKAPLCSLIYDLSCYILKDNKLITKNIFDIYPIYKDTYNNKSKTLVDNQLYTGFLKIFFDSQNNMYMFYNDYNDLKGKYFYFEMYTPDEPTIPKYKQKIYWR